MHVGLLLQAPRNAKPSADTHALHSVSASHTNKGPIHCMVSPSVPLPVAMHKPLSEWRSIEAMAGGTEELP
jgi:hypothetical protein